MSKDWTNEWNKNIAEEDRKGKKSKPKKIVKPK